jgi:hypothetical protein
MVRLREWFCELYRTYVTYMTYGPREVDEEYRRQIKA